MGLRPDYETLKRIMGNALGDLAILAGDDIADADVTWQDVAGTAAVNLRVLAALIEDAREDRVTGPVVFPSPRECLGDR